MIDWSQQRFGQAVRCRITTRPEFNGRQAKQEALAIDGQVLELTPLWLMDEDDPYPGEWALGEPGMLAVNGKLQSAGISWIASGDVTPEEA